MKKVLKILLGAVAIIVLLAVAALTYVILVLDPNDYKPRIGELASQQGVELEISGDLSWRFFPNLALRIGATQISSDDGAIPDTRFNNANLSLAWLPLLKGQVQIHAVTIDGADITLTDAEQGKNTAAAPAAAAGPVEKKNGAQSFTIAVDSFTVNDSRIKLPRQNIELNNLNFEGRGINLRGEIFPVNLTFDYQDPTVTTAAPVAVNGGFGIDLDRDELALRSVEIDIAGLNLTTDTLVTRIQSEPLVNGSVKLAQADLRQLLSDLKIDLPPLPDKETLKRLSFETDFSASAEQVKLKDLVLTLDQTSISGQIGVKLQPPRRLAIVIKGNHIDLNRYLAPEDAEDPSEASTQQAQPAALIFAPLTAPLTFLDGGSSKLNIDWDSLQIDALAIKDIHLVGTSEGTTISIEDFSANTLGGAVEAKIKLAQLTSKTPSAIFSAQLTDIALEDASRTFADNADIEGKLSAKVNGRSRGATTDQLFDRLSAEGTMTLMEPTLKNINIEKSYCDVAALVEKVPPREDWPPGTKLNTTKGQFRMQGRTLLLDNLSTGVGNLALTASGEIDLGAGAFNVLATTRLTGDRTSENGCVVESTRLRDRDIPLRCKDTFAKASASSCRPDGDIVKKLATDKILEKIGEKSGLNEEAGKAVDELFKGLFGR